MWLLLHACTSAEPERTLEVVTAPAEDSGIPDPIPDGDSADSADGEETTLPDELTVSSACGDPSLTLPTGPDVLVIESCSRVTPEEPYSSGDTASGETDTATGPFGPGAPPPCGFVNLVGAVSLAGAAPSPSLLYCDSDKDGGLRFVRPTEDGFRSRLLAPLSCVPDVGSGALLDDGDAFWAAWSANGEEGDGVSGAYLTRLSPEGAVLSEVHGVDLGGVALRVDLVSAGAPLIVAEDLTGGLWTAAVDPDGAGHGTPLLVSDSARRYGLLARDDGAWLAWCDDTRALHLGSVDVAGRLESESLVVDASCGYDATPSLATDGEALALAWDDGSRGHLAFLDGSGAETLRVALGSEAVWPKVGWTGTEWITVDGLGSVRTWSAAGEALGSWVHPLVAVYPGTLVDLRLVAEGGTVSVAMIGMDAYVLGYGHVNSYNYVELSTFRLP